MRITWVTRSFLDYRIPVYQALDALCGNQLTVIFNQEVMSAKLIEKITTVLGERAVGVSGELRIGGKKIENAAFSNTGIRIPFQPGLLRKTTDTRPEVLLSDGFMQWTYAPLIQRVFRKIPHVMCYERTSHTERNCQWYRTLYRKMALRGIDTFCASGSLCGEYLRKLGVAETDIFYGHMVADTDGLAQAVTQVPNAVITELRRELDIDGPVFLYVGQIIPRKGIRQLLEAWKKISPTAASLVLVGDGCEYDELKEWSSRCGLANVHWMGRQPYDKIAQYYRMADVFIIPTLEDNWSLVVPEAMACGLPVACSIYNGCHPELVKPENGWVFDPLDIDATAEMLRGVMKARESLPRMGEASREIVSRHTPRHAAAMIFNACESAVDKNRV